MGNLGVRFFVAVEMTKCGAKVGVFFCLEGKKIFWVCKIGRWVGGVLG